jgi:phospholipase/lecithinase/hemolysin
MYKPVSIVLCLATLVAAQNGTNNKYFISFGDSYSQTGFDINGEKPSATNPLGNPPLPGWTASGGLDWVGFMVTEFNTSLTLSYNFAYGGATVDADLVKPYADTVLSMIDQVQLFSDNIAAQPSYAPWTADNTVVGVWMGVNDVGNTYWNSDSTDTFELVVVAYYEQLQILYDAGLRQFVLLSVPPTQKTPSLIGQGEQAVSLISGAIGVFNDLVASGLEDFVSANTGVTAKLVDTTAAFNEAIENPAEYGAPDATCFNGDGTSCLWFNDYHPGVAIQRLVAAQVAAEWESDFFQCVDSIFCE